MNKVMRDITDSLAEEGYTAVCPDLFWRIEPGIDITDQTDAEWEKAFPTSRPSTSTKALRTSPPPSTGCAPRAAEGRRGGLLPRRACLHGGARTNVDASVGYYGVGIDNYLGEAAKARKQVLLHVAEEDGFVSKDSQAKMKAGLTSSSFQLY